MRQSAARISYNLNRVVEAAVAALMLALIIDVWIGVIDRYYFHWQLPWPEVLARYLMIWAAMLAISSGIARRDHICLTIMLAVLSPFWRHGVLILIDVLAFALFVYVFWFGIGFAEHGGTRQAMIFGATLWPFYSAIPVAAFLAALQLVLVLIRDGGRHLDSPKVAEVAV